MEADESTREPIDEAEARRSRRDYVLIIVAGFVFLLVPLIVAAWVLTR